MTDFYDSMKNEVHLNIRLVDQAYDFDNDRIIPGPCKVVEANFSETMKTFRQRVRDAFDLPADTMFVLVQHELLPNGTIQMASIVTDVPGWEEGFFLVKELYLHHDSDYLLVPVSHPRYADFKHKITIANTKIRIKLRAGDEEHKMFIPRYASNKDLV